ncbi:DUF2892 domain-containing protein [Thioalkalicoccus limnaeus]|uniref:DUF2892 domain-containing protein n=1 Tax=Thioalkalicoccus limnaeus TaxID=120681 RepID=A0ABV4BF39_9GAMM
MNFDYSKHNVGNIDRMIRLIVGGLLILVAFLGSSWVALAALIGAVLIGTAYFRFCPSYTLFDFSSNKEVPL